VWVEVSVRVELPARGDVEQVEALVAAAGRQAMVAAMRQACHAYAGQAVACPACGRAATQRDGQVGRVLRCRFGRVALALERRRCPACGTRFRPADPFLAPLAGSQVTAALAEAAALAGASWPYATAARVLHQLCGAEISPEQVRQVTTRAGTAEADRQWRAAVAVTAPTAAEVRARGEWDAPAPWSGPPPARLLVGLDGGWVASRDQPGGMEGKVGVLATGWTPCGRGRHRLVPRRYVATFGASERLGELAYAAAASLGGERAAQQAVLGDGAGWIKTEAAWHFPAAVTILDWPHLARTVHRSIRAARPGAARRAERRILHQTVADALWHGRVAEARAALVALRPAPPGEPVAALEEALTYLDEQGAWLGDYATWRATGLPVGSGLVERAVALVINRRLKRQGMRWRRAAADAVVALRVRACNATWDDGPADAQRVA
jgi:hypothetical protein